MKKIFVSLMTIFLVLGAVNVRAQEDQSELYCYFEKDESGELVEVCAELPDNFVPRQRGKGNNCTNCWLP